MAEIAHRAGALLIVDNTFATPFFQRPLEIGSGADIVYHSTTKYLNGHSDMVGGIAIVRDDGLAERLTFLQNAAGAVPGPFDSWLALRGTKTLHLRMPRHDVCERPAHRPAGSSTPLGTQTASSILGSLLTRSTSSRFGR